MKRILFSVFGLMLAVLAQATVIQGESVVGTYPNVKVDANGVISTSATSAPTAGTLTDRSGTITSGGVAQVLAAANSTRKYLLIQNTSSGNLWVNFTTTAVQSQPSILLLPNASFVLEGNFVTTEAVSIIGATTSQAFVAKEY